LSFVFFTDRDLGKRFPEILKASGLTVERHDDHFAPDSADETGLAEVGKRGAGARPAMRSMRSARRETESSYDGQQNRDQRHAAPDGPRRSCYRPST